MCVTILRNSNHVGAIILPKALFNKRIAYLPTCGAFVGSVYCAVSVPAWPI
jgi:hypothetical protein